MKIAKKEGIKRMVLLDAHAILHRGYHALPDFSSSKGEPTGALYGLASMLFGIIEDLSPDYLIGCFDLPKPTIRHELYENYKAGRKKTDDELISQIKRSHEVFKDFSIPEFSLEGFEADDILGTIVEEMKGKKDIEIIIASGDMDTLQLVCGDRVRVFTLRKGIKDTILYGEKEVLDRYGFLPKHIPDYKGLAGDNSDNIIGIKGIGEKTATSIIKTYGSLEDFYKALKKNKEKVSKELKLTERVLKLLEEGEDEALFSKMLATIRKDVKINFSLPEKKWVDMVDREKVRETLNNLEFRSLLSRFDNVLKGNGYAKGNGLFGNLEEKKNETKEDGEILKKACIGIWLLNSNLTKPTLDDVLSYSQKSNLKDALKNIEEKLKEKDLFFVYEKIELPLIPIIMKMEKRGILIDQKILAKLNKEYSDNLKKIEKEIWKLSGKEFNVASPKQLGEVLFVDLGLAQKRQKKTAGGAFSTKESELLKLKELHPIIPKILEHRELSKLLSTYIEVIPKLIAKDKRLHSSFFQTGTTTGRMSSENPNLQNIPIKSDLGKAIREAFIATPGFSLVSFDYSQIELRIAAMLSGDEKLIKIFKDGEDVHSGVASEVFSVPIEQVTKEMRRKAKIINFGIIYGMGVTALRENLGGTREEAQKFYDNYFKTFKGIASWIEKTKKEANRLGYTKTMYGRRRYFEGIRSHLQFIRTAAERMAINAPIQGTQADIVKLSMSSIYEFIEKKKYTEDVFFLLQIHDELIFEIKKDKLDEVSVAIKSIMEGIMKDKETQGVPIVSNSAKGESWGTLKDF